MNKGEHAKYPIRRTDIKSFNVPQGILSVTKESIVSGQIPRRIVVGFVTSKAFQGDVTLSPFNFKHFNLNYLVLNVDGEQFPSKPLTPDFANKDYLDCYDTLLTATGIGGDNRALESTRETYPNGYAFYLINLSPSEPDCVASDLVKTGSIRLEAKFESPLTEPITGIIFCEFDSMIEVDRDRVLILDY